MNDTRDENVPQPRSADDASGVTASQDIGMLDLLTVLVKHKRIVVGLPLMAGVVSAILSIAMPNVYTGTAVIMPPQEDTSSASAMIGQLIGSGGGGAAGSGGIASALGLKNTNDLYAGVLESRTIAERLIERFRLQEIYDTDTLVDTRKELQNATNVTAGRDGLITIEVDDEHPKRAAAIANAYVEELEKLTADLAISGASKRRVYFQRHVDSAKESLVKADLGLKAVQERTGLIKPDDQAQAIFEAMAALRGQIAAKEIEISAIRSFATERNPDFLRAQQELAGMQKQLAGLQQDNKLGGGDILVPTGKIPQAGYEFLEKLRDVKYYEAVYEMLARQLELARIDEGRNSTIIQYVDRASPPDKKSKPKRSLIVVIVVLMTGILAVFWVFIKEAYEHAKLAPGSSERMRALKAYLHN